MSKTRKSNNRTIDPPPESASGPGRRQTAAILAILLALIVLVFLPLAQYFFAQDDFVLIYRSWAEPRAALVEFFGTAPGQFRPLTKVLYFAAMYAAFGLNAVPYHLASIALHLLNVLLFFALLRRVGVGMAAALLTTQLFGVNMVFFHIIAWISCVQQLAALTFMLAALIAGLEAMRTGSSRARWLSLAAYVVSLLCVEQTFGVPILLVIIGFFGLGIERRPLTACMRTMAAHLGVMLVYLGFMVLWKQAPDTGPYQPQLGRNVLLNIVAYLGWMYEFWGTLPSVMARLSFFFTVSHVVFSVLLIYHLIRRRFGWIIFALAFFVVTLAPALLLVHHTFYLHTYIPSFGMLLLIALVLDDVLAIRWLRRARVQIAIVCVLMTGVCMLSFAKLRINEREMIPAAPGFRSSFVLRRAIIAEEVYRNLIAKTEDVPSVKQVYFVYGRQEDQHEAVWNVANFSAAIGRGRLVNLAYDNRELLVHFKLVGDTVNAFRPDISRMFVYGDFGKLLTYEEANASIGVETQPVED